MTKSTPPATDDRPRIPPCGSCGAPRRSRNKVITTHHHPNCPILDILNRFAERGAHARESHTLITLRTPHTFRHLKAGR